MIAYQDLIDKFDKALKEKWGYTWGGVGEIWTQADQNEAVREYQKAITAGDQKGIDRWEMSAKYALQWIGKRTVDCSGLFYWAFKQLGGYMYHGSNTMWKSYTTSKGNLKNGKREDGQP